MLGTAPAGVSGNSEIKRMVIRHGSTAVGCTPGRRGTSEALHIEDQLSAYYNVPGRLAVFRHRFENAHRRPGSDPATFATELGILALRGFSDMKEKARDLMVRDKFIASQRSCDLRRHLDGAAPETSIMDIADSCHIWESHGEPADIEDRSQNLKCRQRILPIPSLMISNSKSGVGGLGPATNGPPRREDRNMADRELLIRTVLKVVRERWGTDMNDEGDRGQCFSCAFLGGVLSGIGTSAE